MVKIAVRQAADLLGAVAVDLVVAGAAVHGIVALAAYQLVAALAALDVVVTVLAEQEVVVVSEHRIVVQLGRALRALATVEDGLVHLLRMADHLLGLLLMQLLRAAVERIVAAGAQDEVGAAVALDEVAAAGRLQEVLPGESVGIDLLRVERSEERSVGKGCVSTGRSRLSALPYKKQT